jgi:hypothetical protein
MPASVFGTPVSLDVASMHTAVRPRGSTLPAGTFELRSLIAHGIGVGGFLSQPCSFALTTAAATLLLSVCFATRRASVCRSGNARSTVPQR